MPGHRLPSRDTVHALRRLLGEFTGQDVKGFRPGMRVHRCFSARGAARSNDTQEVFRSGNRGHRPYLSHLATTRRRPAGRPEREEPCLAIDFGGKCRRACSCSCLGESWEGVDAPEQRAGRQLRNLFFCHRCDVEFLRLGRRREKQSQYRRYPYDKRTSEDQPGTHHFASWFFPWNVRQNLASEPMADELKFFHQPQSAGRGSSVATRTTSRLHKI